MTEELSNSRNKEPLIYESEYKVIKSFIDNQNFNDGFNYLSDKQKQFTPSVTPQDKLVLEVLLCILQAEASKLHENLQLIPTLENSIQDQLMLIDFTIAKAETLWKSGKQAESLESIKGIDIPFSDFKNTLSGQASNPEIIERESDINNIKGITSWFLGNVQNALMFFEQSLHFREQLSNKKKIAASLNNLGIIYTYLGELEIALDQYNRVVELLKDSPNKEDLASPYANIGQIYQYMGHFGFALDFYELAMDIFDKTDHKLRKANVYSLILNLHLESKNIPEAQIYLDKLKPLDDPPGENRYIYALITVDEGLILKNTEGLRNKFKAGENFLQIANGPVVDSELTAKAIFNLNDILLLEMRLEKNDNNLPEIQNWLNKLIKISVEHNSSVLLIQCYLFDSKLKLLEFKVKEAKGILNRARELANEKGLKKYEYVIAKELDQILSQEAQWVNLGTKGANIVERLDLAGLEKTLDDLIHKRQDKTELIDLIKQSIGPNIQNIDNMTNEQILENFYKYILDATYITVFRMSVVGPVIYLTDELNFIGTDKEIVEIKLGVYFTTALGQGENNNIGVFGPLPFPDTTNYLSIIYSCFMKDPENADPRANGKSYCLYIVTFPKAIEPYYDNKRLLLQIFDKFQAKFDKIQDLTQKDLAELKVKLVK